MDYITDNAVFTGLISRALSARVPGLSGLRILDRRPAAGNGTFRAEILTCTWNGQGPLRLRCKFLEGHENNQEGGHRKGVGFEARVYDQILSATPLSLPGYYGSVTIPESGIQCLLIEYLEGSLRMNQSKGTDTLERAASWIGAFHRYWEHKAPGFLTPYSYPYYDTWISNSRSILRETGQRGKDLLRLTDLLQERLPELVDGPLTIVHGEYYPNNILSLGDRIYPVDWESAAIAAGEIDLAGVLEGYPRERWVSIMEHYCAARWPEDRGSAAASFRDRLDLARLYFYFRWIGRYPSLSHWTEQPGKLHKLEAWLSRLEAFEMSAKA